MPVKDGVGRLWLRFLEWADDAPSYEMPAIKLGRDWATATVGTTVTLSRSFTGLAAFTAQTGQTGLTSYGGRVGLNYAPN